MKETNDLRNQLKAIRARLGLSQQELALTAGVARQTIGGIENGDYAPSAAVALRLAKALGCRMEEVFWLEEESAVLEAVPALPFPPDETTRLTLAKIGERWMAYPLRGASAFRSEMVPADGVGTVNTENGKVAARLLDDPETLGRAAVLAGCAPALSLWARSAEQWQPGLRVHWIHANSTAALASLASGAVHGAGLHLYDAATGESNVPFARKALSGRRAVLVNLGVWDEGFVVASGNPKGLRGASDLAQAGVTMINRDAGSGSRLLLEDELSAAGISVKSVAGYEDCVSSHQEVAAAVAGGRADAGISAASIAAAYGLGFVPLRRVRYDMAFLEEYLYQEPVKQLLNTLTHRRVRSQLALLGGYDTAATGEITALFER